MICLFYPKGFIIAALIFQITLSSQQNPFQSTLMPLLFRSWIFIKTIERKNKRIRAHSWMQFGLLREFHK
jgi:hypothetical protein